MEYTILYSTVTSTPTAVCCMQGGLAGVRQTAAAVNTAALPDEPGTQVCHVDGVAENGTAIYDTASERRRSDTGEQSSISSTRCLNQPAKSHCLLEISCTPTYL